MRVSRAVKIVLLVIAVVLLLAIFLQIALQPSLQSNSSAPDNQQWDTVITDEER